MDEMNKVPTKYWGIPRPKEKKDSLRDKRRHKRCFCQTLKILTFIFMVSQVSRNKNQSPVSHKIMVQLETLPTKIIGAPKGYIHHDKREPYLDQPSRHFVVQVRMTRVVQKTLGLQHRIRLFQTCWAFRCCHKQCKLA